MSTVSRQNSHSNISTTEIALSIVLEVITRMSLQLKWVSSVRPCIPKYFSIVSANKPWDVVFTIERNPWWYCKCKLYVSLQPLKMIGSHQRFTPLVHISRRTKSYPTRPADTNLIVIKHIIYIWSQLDLRWIYVLHQSQKWKNFHTQKLNCLTRTVLMTENLISLIA